VECQKKHDATGSKHADERSYSTLMLYVQIVPFFYLDTIAGLVDFTIIPSTRFVYYGLESGNGGLYVTRITYLLLRVDPAARARARGTGTQSLARSEPGPAGPGRRRAAERSGNGAAAPLRLRRVRLTGIWKPAEVTVALHDIIYDIISC
jgi:hypothetical protein